MNLIAALLLVAAVVVVILALLWLRPGRATGDSAQSPAAGVDANAPGRDAADAPKGVTFRNEDAARDAEDARRRVEADVAAETDAAAAAEERRNADLLAEHERRAAAATTPKGVSFRDRDREAVVARTGPIARTDAPLPPPRADRPAVLVDEPPPPPLPPRRSDDAVAADDRTPVIPSRARTFVRDSMGDRNVTRARADLEILGEAIVRFRSIVNRNPNRLTELTRPVPGYVDGLMGPAGLPTDPWGRDYVYDGDTAGDGAITLRSLGSDGKRDGTGYAADLVHTPTE